MILSEEVDGYFTIPKDKAMYSNLLDFFSNNNIEYFLNVSTARYSSAGIGNEAAILLFPHNENQLIGAINYLRGNSIKHRLVGRMTNLLPKDDYYDGVIVSTRKMRSIYIDGKCVAAECGVTLPTIILTAAEHSLGGAESLSGIPGSLGGAVYSNAGAFGSEISDFLDTARVYDMQSGNVLSLIKEELSFSYRSSILKDKKLILLSARLRFHEDTRENIKNKIGEVKNKRTLTQPLEYPSLGSVFKRCGDIPAAKLIDECGLKGRTVGGASVSSKHAGFIVNVGGATEKDFTDLISIIKDEVFEKFSVLLEEEIEYL